MDHLSNFFLFFLARSFIQTVDRRTKGSSLPLLYIERLQYPTKERASVLYFLQTVRSRSLLHPVLYVDLSCNIPTRGNLIKTIARGRMNELDEGRMFSFFFLPSFAFVLVLDVLSALHTSHAFGIFARRPPPWRITLDRPFIRSSVAPTKEKAKEIKKERKKREPTKKRNKSIEVVVVI